MSESTSISAGGVALRRPARPASVAARDRAEPSVEVRLATLRLARVLFFAGALTVTQAKWRPAGLALSELFFIASFACCCFAVLRGRPIAPLPATLITGAVLFAVGGGVSSLDSAAPNESAVEVVTAVYVMALWVWTAAMVLTDRRDILIVLALWSVSGAVSGGAAVAQALGVDWLAGPAGGGRATGFTEHPNDLGGGTAVALVPALVLAIGLQTRSLLDRGARWLVVALVAAGLLASGSVGGMAAALTAVTLWLIGPSIRGSGRLVIVLAGLILLTAGGTFLGDDIASPQERIEQVTGAVGSAPNTGSAQERIKIVEQVWPRIAQDPFVGKGLAAEDIAVRTISAGYQRNQQVHGAPLAAWYNAGILGLIGMLLVFASLAMVGLRSARAAAGGPDELIAWGLMAAFAGFVVYALTAPLYFQQYGWIAAAVLVAWGRVVAVRPEADERPPRSDGATRPPARAHPASG